MALGQSPSGTLAMYCSEFVWSVLALRDYNPTTTAAEFQGTDSDLREAAAAAHAGDRRLSAAPAPAFGHRFTFNFENADTDYKTDNEFHGEWAVVQNVSKQLGSPSRGLSWRL